MICKFDRVRISHSKRQKSYMSIEKLKSTHALNYIVLRVNNGLTSCKDLATALGRSEANMPAYFGNNKMLE